MEEHLYPSKSSTALPIGRWFAAAIFVISGFMKFFNWQMMQGYVAARGLPAPELLLGIAAFIEVICGLALLVGYKSKIAAAILFVYLIPVTLIFHNFWASPTPAEAQMQTVNFLKNLAIMGGLLYISIFGSGRWSVDSKVAGALESGRDMRRVA